VSSQHPRLTESLHLTSVWTAGSVIPALSHSVEAAAAPFRAALATATPQTAVRLLEREVIEILGASGHTLTCEHLHELRRAFQAEVIEVWRERLYLLIGASLVAEAIANDVFSFDPPIA